MEDVFTGVGTGRVLDWQVVKFCRYLEKYPEKPTRVGGASLDVIAPHQDLLLRVSGVMFGGCAVITEKALVYHVAFRRWGPRNTRTLSGSSRPVVPWALRAQR